jgi:hypothetical protein
MINKNMKTPFIILACFSIIVMFYFIITRIQSAQLTKDFDVEVVGIVYEKKHIDHGHGMFYLKNVQANYQYYDLRHSHPKSYLCVIQKDSAEIVYSFFQDIEVGDSMCIHEKKFSVFRNRKVILSKDLVVNELMDNTVSAVRKLHRIHGKNEDVQAKEK